MRKTKYKTTKPSQEIEAMKVKIGEEIAKIIDEKKIAIKYFPERRLATATLYAIIKNSKDYTFNSLLLAIDIIGETPQSFFARIK